MRRLVAVFATALLATACADQRTATTDPTPLLSAATVEQERVFFQGPAEAWIPCANDGAGEFVDFTVEGRIKFSTVFNDNNFTSRAQYKVSGPGVGRSSGESYSLQSVQNYSASGPADGSEVTARTVIFSRINGKGSTPNWRAQLNVTDVWVNGTPVSSVVKVDKVTCK